MRRMYNMSIQHYNQHENMCEEKNDFYAVEKVVKSESKAYFCP